MNTLVLGIGNSLMTDDGAGVHAALRLAERVGDDPTLTVLDAGTLSFSLLHYLETADALIAFDATRSGLGPGGLSVYEGDAFDRFVQRNGRSVHEVGLADLLDMARLSDRLPDRRVLIGIEPVVIDWGLEPTPDVARTLPDCVDVALRYVERWRSAAEGTGAEGAHRSLAVDPLHSASSVSAPLTEDMTHAL